MIDRACISLNNNCNMRCRYCHFQDKQKDFDSFSFQQLKLILDNIHAYCFKRAIKKFKLGLVGSGEPMLKADVMLEALGYVSALDYSELSIYTISNGTLFTEDLLRKFLRHRDRIKICVSLDGYEEIHNIGRQAFDRVIGGIEMYKSVFGEYPAINATATMASYKNKERLVNFFKENGLYDVTFSVLVGCSEKDLFISYEDFLTFMEYVKETGLKSRQFRDEKCYDCIMYGKLCGVGRSNIFIAPEGIYPCGRFYKMSDYYLGAYDATLDEIEEHMHRFTPVQDGKCYYIENIEVMR